jgi:hypothetical protein
VPCYRIGLPRPEKHIKRFNRASQQLKYQIK